MGDRPLNMAVFADYENVAIGARDAGFGDFDLDLVLHRLLDKGNIILKKAYCDWSRYASARKALHTHGFELIEVPHVSLSGKNSADIRLTVDAIDLCHTKPHLDLFAIISGDSDFSPLVAKLRENGRDVIGVGVKSSTSRILLQSCDEFVYYDDLVHETAAQDNGQGKDHGDPAEAYALVADTARRLLKDRGEPVWGSHVKQVLKRKRPQFNEGYFGFRSFSEVLEGARDDGRLDVRKDEPSGGYVVTRAR